jgi:2,3-bisphosphoglycerate-dependent phosphoglycerate mutase
LQDGRFGQGPDPSTRIGAAAEGGPAGTQSIQHVDQELYATNIAQTGHADNDNSTGSPDGSAASWNLAPAGRAGYRCRDAATGDTDMPQLALIRHGQSEWNLENRFTGWVDVDLSEKGIAEARRSGELLAAAGFKPVRAYVSLLKRAIKTLHLVLENLDRMWIPEEKSWRLNERHYGGLAGLNKDETRAKHGAEQVKIWRRSFDTPPPPVEETHEYHPVNDERYARVPREDLPASESLKTTLQRVEPYWNEEILPRLRAGEDVIIAAHGNSLRALVKLLFKVSDDAIMEIEVPTGNPLLIDLAEDGMTVLDARYLDKDRAQSLPPLP